MRPGEGFAPSTAGCWPNPLQDLLLTAALGEPAAAAQAWRTWREHTAIDTIDQASFRLLPLIYFNNARRGVFGDDEARLRGVYRQNWARNQRRVHLAGQAIAELSCAGIATLGLKGLVFGSRYYGSLGARSMADIDIVTTTDDVARALGVLEASGWRLLYPPFAREQRRGCSSTLVNATGDELDLHWHILLVQPFASVDDVFWRGSEVFEIGGAPSRALQPADELLHTIVHGLHWNVINSLRWIADAVTVVRHAPHVDWDRLLDAADRYGLAPPVSLALAYLHDRFDAIVPGVVVGRARALGSTAGDRLEWWARMRGPAMPPGPLGYVVRYWRQWRRLRHAGEPSGFLRYVADSLRVEGTAQLARAVTQHTLQRARWGAAPQPSVQRRG